MTGVRQDIQALRGVAVALVLLYHARLGGLAAGYLGVDIFFVISGFLITSLVMGGIERGDFRLRDFYLRRARRLLPAAYVTFLMTALAAPWFLNQSELHDLAAQLAGAVSFTANLVLHDQTGYFAGPSELKPLLHTWSLSIEEQYYLLLPAALVLLRGRRAWWPAISLAFAGSLIACWCLSSTDPSGTFYLLPTRAWELLTGSIGALLVRGPGAADRVAASPLLKVMFYPALIALLLPAFMPLPGAHPGASAVLVCAATLAILLRRHEGLEANPVVRALARLGDISYSLYLVHWPVIALVRNAWIGSGQEMPMFVGVAELAVSLLLAVLLHRFVEEPTRHAKAAPRRVWSLAFGGALLLLLTAWPMTRPAPEGTPDFTALRKANYGLDAACDLDGPFTPSERCGGDQARLLVWGDSFAMHLVPGLQAQFGSLIQATHSTCGPLLGLAPYKTAASDAASGYDEAWAQRCIAFNQSVLDFLRARPNIQVVVLSSVFTQYVDPEWSLLDGEGSHAASVERSTHAMLATAAAIRAAGRKVILIAPPPAQGFNVGSCLERRLTGRLTLGAPEGCEIDVAAFHEARARVLAVLTTAEMHGLPVIRPETELCSERSCTTYADGVMLYRDGGHLSIEGSRWLARKMDWRKLIDERAR